MIKDDDAEKEARREKIGGAEYEIGFGKPPKKHQFKSKQSGNPKGRPKGAKGLKALVREAAEATVELNLNGKKTKTTRLGAALHQLSVAAAKGGLKATDKLAKLYETYGPAPEPEIDASSAAADAQVLEEFLAFAAKFGKTATP